MATLRATRILAPFPRRRGRPIAAPETLRDIGAAAGASVTIDGGKALPPMRSSGGTPPGAAGRRYRHGASVARPARTAFATDPAAAARRRDAAAGDGGRRRATPSPAGGGGGRPAAADRKLPSEPDRVRTALLSRRTFHRSRGLRTGLRTAIGDGSNDARCRRVLVRARRRDVR